MGNYEQQPNLVNQERQKMYNATVNYYSENSIFKVLKLGFQLEGEELFKSIFNISGKRQIKINHH